MTDATPTLLHHVRRIDWSTHGITFFMGVYALFILACIVGSIGAAALIIGTCAYRFYPWSLLVVPGLGTTYFLGWAFLRV